MLKQDLKVWNKEVIEYVFSNKKVALAQIGFWDAKERDLGLSLEDIEARRRVVEDFNKWASMEETSWRQKWLKEGDKNSRFFHKMANA